MLHLIRCRMVQILREKSLMFWGLGFPIILATLFYAAFGNLGTESFADIPAAVVTVSENTAFSEYLQELDGSLLSLASMESSEAVQALEDGTVSGIFYEEENPFLTVAGSGIEETLLSSLMESFDRNASILQDIARTCPEQLPAALEALSGYQSYTEAASLGGKTYDSVLEYFFALIAMACFYGTFLGATLSNENNASFSALGARRAIAPVPKAKIVTADMIAGTCIHFSSVLLLLAYLILVLQIELRGNPGMILLICFLGSLSGVSLGAIIGCARIREGFQTLLTVIIPLVLCFLAGLMFAGMKQIIEQNIPLLNRINPAALISDALYCLVVYEDAGRLGTRLALLVAFCLALTIFACLRMRRLRYDSI